MAAESTEGAKRRPRRRGVAGVRRIHLTRIRYYLFYRVVSDPQAIEILALWHSSRQGTPALPK